jgi:Rad3-related DNA helicase
MVKLRDVQVDAISLILDAINKGKTDIFVQAPTGTGKSLIALELAKEFSQDETGTGTFILTSDRLLQQQYEDDCSGKFSQRHSDVVNISGIDNYNCSVNGNKFSLGWCKSMGMSNSKALAKLPCAATCEYLQRWSRAKNSKTTVFNYSYYLIQMNYVLRKLGAHAPFGARDLVICDEAHSLPDIIESHFACSVDMSWVTKIKEICDSLREDEVWIEFLGVKWGDLAKSISSLFKLKYADLENHLAGLSNLLIVCSAIQQRIADSKQTLRFKYKLAESEGDNMEEFMNSVNAQNQKIPTSVKEFMSFADEFKDYMCKMEDYVEIINAQGLDNMVIEGTANGRKYHNLCDERLFENHFKPFSKVRIYLSATLQPENMIKRFCLDPETTEVITLNSGWNPQHSPVILRNIANFKWANIQNAIDDAVIEVEGIMSRHQNERGIIHTTSYDITRAIVDRVSQSHRLHTYSNTADKIKLLGSIQDLPQDAIIIGPSLTQGVDLHDDLARFNVIVKLSYPNIGSSLWRKRFQKKRWIYWADAANTLEQAAGRATRHRKDRSTTYILDSRANKFITNKSTRKMFSSEFLDRIRIC